MKKVQLANNEIYHIVIRGVDKSLIFKDRDDYYRGIFSLYEFNDTKPVEIRKRREQRKKVKDSGGQTSAGTLDNRNFLVDILSFYFMPNHIHLLLRQVKDNGISQFMQKLGTGYAAYFNKKYSRKGHLFQGRFRVVYIEDDSQLKTVFVYIHTNGISLIEPNWKEKGIKKPEKVIKFLENYKWSSYSDYLGKKNFPSVTERKFISEIMGGEQGCRDFVENWVRYKGKINKFPNLFLD